MKNKPKNKQTLWTWYETEEEGDESRCAEYRSEWGTKMIRIIQRLCFSCHLHSTEQSHQETESWRLQTRRDAYHVHTRTLWTAMHHIYFFHARVHLHTTKGFYSKQQSESNFCLWPCDLNATSVPASCVKIHLLLTFNQTSESPMRGVVPHEDTACEWASPSQQLTGHSRETNKTELATHTCTSLRCLIWERERLCFRTRSVLWYKYES
jgi:hypothetical protein